MSKTFANWPPSLSDAQKAELVQQAIDWSTAHGLLLRTGTGADAVHVPFALFPSPFPRLAFQQVTGAMQLSLNRLVHRISLDHQFLESIFEKLAKVDEFTGRLYGIWKRLQSSPELKCSSVSLGLHRSDYMLHQATGDGGAEFTAQMVELNTISVSFSSLTHLVGDMHKYLTKRTNYYNDADTEALDITLNALPPNQSLTSLADGLWEAWRIYNNPKAVVILIVQSAERNVFDQRWIEWELFERHGIRSIRKTMQQLANELFIHSDTGVASINGVEIAVVYYRAGYGPGDYPSETEWQTRERLERSMAIKCPTIAYQLVGAKKVQQVLAQPGVLERFVADKSELKLIRSSFTGIYPLDDSPLGLDSYQRALECPGRFVLKPQREGGGNNFYGEQVRHKLLELSSEERSAYILMDRIQPAPFRNILVRQGEPVESSVVSELGVYGVYLADGEREIVNRSAGHLLRTKMSSTDEGGVASGFASKLSNKQVFGMRQQILNVALYKFVPRLGWSSASVAQACRSMGYPATMKSLVGNGEMELIAHAVEQKLATLTESPSSNSIDPQRFYGNVYERAVLLLKYQQQFASNWIQAVEIMRKPTNLPRATELLGRTVDELAYQSGDRSFDMLWYGRRAALAALYASAELYMTQDMSEGFVNTDRFLRAQLQRAKELEQATGTVESMAKVTFNTLTGAFH